MTAKYVDIYMYFTYTDDSGNTITDGSLTTKLKEINCAGGEYFDRTYVISSGATATTLWNDDSPAISDFDFLWIESSQDCEVQLMCNEDGAVSSNDLENTFCLKLLAGVPLVLSTDDSRTLGDCVNPMTEANFKTENDLWEDSARRPAGNIDRIEYTQSSGSDAKVRIFAAT